MGISALGLMLARLAVGLELPSALDGVASFAPKSDGRMLVSPLPRTVKARTFSEGKELTERYRPMNESSSWPARAAACAKATPPPDSRDPEGVPPT